MIPSIADYTDYNLLKAVGRRVVSKYIVQKTFLGGLRRQECRAVAFQFPLIYRGKKLPN